MPMNWSLSLVSNQRFTSKLPFYEAIVTNRCVHFLQLHHHISGLSVDMMNMILIQSRPNSKVSKRKLSAIRGKKNFRAKHNMFFAGESVRL